MKKQGINFALVVIAAVFLTLLALRVRVAETADSVAVLETSGMTCSSCSAKITQALKTTTGVAASEVDVQGGWVVVGYNTAKVQPETLARTVSTAGFKSTVHLVLSPEQFQKLTGRAIGADTGKNGGCCGKGGCNANKTQG